MTVESGKGKHVPGSYPFKVTHIGVITRDIDKTIKQYEAMGAGPFKRFQLTDEEFAQKRRWNYDIDTSDHVYAIAYGQLSAGFGVEIFQLLQCPNPEKNIAHQFLVSKGEGIWHLGHDVENMEEAIAWMKNAGYEVIGGSEYMDGTLMCYFDTAKDFGYVIQLHQVVKGGAADLLTNPVEKK
jgi:methylmalonyl-CoA/ethylmalonyl-CoA epimerase